MAFQRLLPANSRRLWQCSLFAAAIVFLLHFAVTTAVRRDTVLLGTACNLLTFFESAAAMITLALVALYGFRKKQPGYPAWAFLSLAMLGNTMGEGIWWVLQRAEGQVPVPSLSDPFYLSFYPFIALGIAVLPAIPHQRSQKLWLGLDMGAVFLAGALVFWVFGIGPLVSNPMGPDLELAGAVAYPAGDLAVLAALLLLLSRRVHPVNRAPLKLLAAGAAIVLVADSLFSYQVLNQVYISGDYPDLGYTAAYLLFALAGVRQVVAWREAAWPTDPGTEGAQPGVQVLGWTALLPYATMLLAFVLLVWNYFHPTGMNFPTLVTVLGAIIVLLGVRQFLAIAENDALHKAQRELNAELLRARDELEARVELRTRELQEANIALGEEVLQHELAAAELQASLREKEVLLKEIHHRVKNNLQVVSSLLSLQSDAAKNRAATDILVDGQARIRAMSLIHEKLYGSSDFDRIDFGDYLRTLVGQLSTVYQVDREVIELELQTIQIWLGLDVAVPCGLILNELLSNALQHAFPDNQKGMVSVQLAEAGDGRLRLTVADDGVGLPSGLDFRNASTLGLQLAGLLARQIDGQIEVNCSHGTRFDVTFPPTC